MNITKNKRNLLVCISVIVSLLSSCIPVMDYGCAAPGNEVEFKNCMNDTLFIGLSHYDNVDSVDAMMYPYYELDDDNDPQANIFISLWGWDYLTAASNGVYPDSLCRISEKYLFDNTDTCYVFLVKHEDARNHSWDEIRTKKLYKKWIVIRNEDGEFDRNIKYSE